MNYRHAYHAGNFADVLKHAVLTLVLEYMKRKEAPFRVIDTHAGAGRYALASPQAEKTGEWQGGIARLIGEVIAWGSSGYDVFPSLHVMVTCILLEHDWREVRRRFWIMLGPCIGLFISTIYLRYHYAVDIFAGFLLFLLLRQAILKTQIVRIGWQQ